MSIDTVTIEAGATLGPHSVILPAANIGANATVGPGIARHARRVGAGGQSVERQSDRTLACGEGAGVPVCRRMSADAYTPQSGDPGIRVDHYDLTLDYKVSTNRLSGTAVIRGRSLIATRTLSFDLVGRAGDAGSAWARAPRPSSRATASSGSRCRRRSGAGQSFEITVAYAGAPRPRRSRWGTIGWEELDDGALVASQPTGAPTWFPCNDVPSDKATSRVSLHDRSRVHGRRRRAARRRVSRAAAGRPGRSSRTCPTPTYLMTVQVGRYIEETVALGGPVGRLFYPPALAARVRADFADLRRMVAVFVSSFGPVPARRVRGGGHRRRPRDPARGAGDRRLRREPHRRRGRPASGSSRTSSPTSGSATASASRSGRTSGSTRDSPATRSGSGRSTPAAPRPTRRRSRTTRGSRRCRRISW